MPINEHSAALQSLQTEGRKIAILGQMNELESTRNKHQQLLNGYKHHRLMIAIGLALLLSLLFLQINTFPTSIRPWRTSPQTLLEMDHFL